MPVSPVALGAGAAGVLLVWSALNDRPLAYAAQQVIQGKSPQGSGTAASVQTAITGAALATTPSSVASGSTSANQAIARMLAAPYGWSSGPEWDALVSLWDRESGWSNTIWNGGSHADTLPPGSSGAYGIPQALPYSKMPESAWPPGYGGNASASAQISWGLAYIKDSYGDPIAANNFDANHPGY